MIFTGCIFVTKRVKSVTGSHTGGRHPGHTATVANAPIRETESKLGIVSGMNERTRRRLLRTLGGRASPGWRAGAAAAATRGRPVDNRSDGHRKVGADGDPPDDGAVLAGATATLGALAGCNSPGDAPDTTTGPPETVTAVVPGDGQYDITVRMRGKRVRLRLGGRVRASHQRPRGDRARLGDRRLRRHRRVRAVRRSVSQSEATPVAGASSGRWARRIRSKYGTITSKACSHSRVSCSSTPSRYLTASGPYPDCPYRGFCG